MRTATSTTFTGVFRGGADQVGHARHEVARYLEGCPAAEDAELIISELVTNAVLHSRSRHGLLTVHGERYPGYVWIEVSDDSASFAATTTAELKRLRTDLGIAAALAVPGGAGQATAERELARVVSVLTAREGSPPCAG